MDQNKSKGRGILKVLWGALFISFMHVSMGQTPETTTPSQKAMAISKLKEAGVTDEQIAAIMGGKSPVKDSVPTAAAADRLRVQEKDTSLAALPSGPKGELLDSTMVPIDTNGVYGHALFRNTSLKHYDRTKDLNPPDNYVIGPGDQIGVSVWGFSEFNGLFRVQQDGYIEHRLVGRMYVKGQTFGEARKSIAQKFGKQLDLRNSEISINLSSSRMINVNIVGEVKHPGTYTIPAINTAFMALVAAGGPGESGSVRNILIKRGGKTVDTLDVYKFLMNPGSEDAIYLQENDYIFVQVAGKVLSIQGEVRRPMRYELKQGEYLMDLISYAGGFHAAAYKSVLQLTRFQHNHEVLISVNLDSLNQIQQPFGVEDGDRVEVRAIREGYVNHVKAIGAFKIPGDYEVRPGDRVSDMLRKCDGLSIDAFAERAFVIRREEDMSRTYFLVNLRDVLENEGSKDNIELKGKDEVIVLSRIDFQDDFEVEVFGAVRKPGKFIYGSGLSLNDAIFLAGGLKKEAAYNRVEIFRVVDYQSDKNALIPIKAIVNTIEVNGNLSLDKANEIQLQPFDEVFVRTNPDFEPAMNVYLGGEVKYPGTYALLKKNETVAELVKRAGGLNDYAFVQGVTMNRALDSIGTVYLDLETAFRRPKSKYNLVLSQGDSINIPKTLDLIHISGSLGYETDQAISAPFFGKRASFYVRHFAGGFNRMSNRRETYVIYPSGIMRKTFNMGLFKIFPRVRKGCRIVVHRKPDKNDAERKPTDWNRAIENFTIKATGVLTLWILADKITN